MIVLRGALTAITDGGISQTIEGDDAAAATTRTLLLQYSVAFVIVEVLLTARCPAGSLPTAEPTFVVIAHRCARLRSTGTTLRTTVLTLRQVMLPITS